MVCAAGERDERERPRERSRVGTFLRELLYSSVGCTRVCGAARARDSVCHVALGSTHSVSVPSADSVACVGATCECARGRRRLASPPQQACERRSLRFGFSFLRRPRGWDGADAAEILNPMLCILSSISSYAPTTVAAPSVATRATAVRMNAPVYYDHDHEVCAYEKRRRMP